ncbi:MAG: hypothetical protein JW942_01005 [Opitutales bacterium]|nr:hypothetical protein [Opitutales bacterium]
MAPLLNFPGRNGAAALASLAAAVLLWRRPDSVKSLHAIGIIWLSCVMSLNLSSGLDTLCNIKILIPIGDSAGYCSEAANLAAGGQFSHWAAAHTLSHSFFASLLFISGRDLILTHMMAGLLAALSISCATQELRRSMGTIAAAAFMCLSMVLMTNSLCTFASETLALSFALLGTGMMLHGVREKRLAWAVFGLFILSLALAARPGAMLVIPLAGIAIASLGESWKQRASTLALAALASVSALLLNALLTKLLCEPSAVPMSMDFWHHMNGMLNGTSWNASIATKSAAEAKDSVLEVLRNKPASFFTSSWKAIRFFFAEDVAFAFQKSHTLTKAMTLLLGAGFITCLIRFRDGTHRLVLFSQLGILLSIPFVPPWDAGIRPYTATMPLQFLGTFIGLAAIERFINAGLPERIRSRAPRCEKREWHMAAVAAIGLFPTVILPPLLAFGPLHLEKPASYYHEGRMKVRLITGSYLRIRPNEEVAHSFVPDIAHADFIRPQAGFTWLFRADETAVYSRLPSEVIITRADAVGTVFIIKDTYGDELPDTVECNADLLQMRGDRIVFDKRIGFDAALAEGFLESVYLPWFTGYDCYYAYHPAIGSLHIMDSTPGGKVTFWTEKYGVLETDKTSFPFFIQRDSGKSYRLDIPGASMLEESPDKAQ